MRLVKLHRLWSCRHLLHYLLGRSSEAVGLLFDHVWWSSNGSDTIKSMLLCADIQECLPFHRVFKIEMEKILLENLYWMPTGLFRVSVMTCCLQEMCQVKHSLICGGNILMVTKRGRSIS